ncbi:hypothetical protein RRG08_046651 [Elysia crispata]|uniref:HMG box domain-containing protein n=1 Tax=Elysia crispata TaxID=231223 RepID=A0AAE1AT89_9GAST|nr:hypothetical protein RRG08_046651 [Elysia crispata]
MKPLKLAHRDGHTSVCYDTSGSFILTGGSDGKVCIWEGKDDTDTTTVAVGEKVFAVAFQGGRFFAATDENTIRIHTFPDGVGDGLVTRFTSPCRCFCISEDGSLLIAGADDFKIKVISMEENECICLYSEHQAPILSVSFDPTKEFAASASCDGTVKIWGIHDGTTEKSLNLLTKCSEPSQAKSLCQMCWSKDGDFLLIPVQNEIHVCLRSSWEVIKKIQHSDVKEAINTMVMSQDGTYLAFGCVNGEMGIYHWQDMKLIDKHSHPKRLSITSMSWNPKNQSEVAFCDNSGQLGFLDTVVATSKPSDTNQAAENNAFNDADDDDILASANGEGADLDEINKFLDDGDEENSIDIGSIKRSLLPEENDNDDAASVVSSKIEDSRPVQQGPAAPSFPPVQAPFQPGSTPEHLSNRFMVWNSVGIIRQYVTDDENSIDVEFHDTSTHHALHIDNKNDFEMADLSSQAVVFASHGAGDGPSKLLCMHFGSWDSHKEWSYDMPEGENIQAITVSDKWAALATDSRTIRIFSIGGLQRHVFTLPGDVVSLASHRDRLLVAYHRGLSPIPGDQCMGVYLMRIGQGSSFKVIVNGEALPLSRASKLAWLGFSDEGAPFYMDVEGIVRTQDKHCWVPVANTRQLVKGKSDHYWLVSISLKQQQIRCIPCKGSRFPATLPRPALAVLPLQMSLCDMESEKSKYEEAYQRNSLISRSLAYLHIEDCEEINKAVREDLMKLFAFAAKSERDFRALEVCEMMGDQSLLQIAATYAMRLRRMQLAERVNEYINTRQQQQEEDDEINLAEEEFNAENASLRHDESDEEEECETMDTDSQPEQISGPCLVTKVEKSAKSIERPSGRLNPFKVTGSADRKSVKGTQIFDKMEKTTPKASNIFVPLPVSIKKSGKKPSGNQTKLGFSKGTKTAAPEIKNEVASQNIDEGKSENQPMKKKASAFDLWFEANKEEIRNAHPEESDEDLVQKAAEDFRAMSKEDRQVWVQKAKSENAAVTTSEAAKKRKMPTEENEHQKAVREEPKRIKTDPELGKKAPLSQSTNAKLARFAKSD